ncbi:uncharacterized protein DS421_9g286640 [Arachis hypogaea]|nr:uncharacterized protein DS421_9g286640 [Arachis hypogaea]
MGPSMPPPTPEWLGCSLQVSSTPLREHRLFLLVALSPVVVFSSSQQIRCRSSSSPFRCSSAKSPVFAALPPFSVG